MSNIVFDHVQHSAKVPQHVRPKILYPALIIAAFAVTLLSLTGVAALTGHLPGANASNVENAAQASAQTQSMSASNGVSGQPSGQQVAMADCATCGTVESVRLIERRGSGSGLGAVTGGVVGAIVGNQFGGGTGRTLMTIAGAGGGAYAGNEIEKNVKKSSAYQIRIRMNDGTVRTLSQHDVPGVNTGDHVRLSNGRISQVL
ncbi:MAG TPA: glycine zipper 2TM domain-containing protein [Rhodocyclaceae bacterium]|jgi:outer membrane lipoprotein SlyB|nr:glycine zipper 2TM domain-containing protein [Rhodocyclaceae bacterium]